MLKGIAAAITDEKFTASVDETNEFLNIEAADIASNNVLILSENLTTETVTSIRNGSVRFVRDPNMDHGTVCQIGDNWFCFGRLKAEELDPDEYVKATPEADVVGLICNTLDEFRKSGETFEDEYAYYEAYLNEQRAKAIPTLKERDKRLEQLWAEFGDVPMNPETEEIEAQFLCFPAGTNREEVWEWFDERYSRGVVKLLLVGEPKDREVAQALFLTSLCCECDSEHCVFNPDGICKAPFVTGRAPGLNDDGCTDYCYKEAE